MRLRVSICAGIMVLFSLLMPATMAKNVYNSGAYPTLSSKVAKFESRLQGDDITRYKLMVEIANLLAEQDSGNKLFQESRGVLMQMWCDDYPLIAEQSLATFIAQGLVIDKKRLPDTTFWAHSTTANSFINVRKDNDNDSFIKVRMNDRKSIDDFLDTERPHIIHAPDRSGSPSEYQSGKGAEAGWSAEKIGVLEQAGDLVHLKGQMNNPNVYVRFAVANALRNLGDDVDGKTILLQIANANEHYYSRKAAQILAREGDSRGVARLQALGKPPRRPATYND